jgi:hypothetical protein
MSAEQFIPQPPVDLVREGQRWVRRELMAGNSQEMEKFLRGLFVNGIGIFRTHQKGILQQIEQEDGVSEITYAFLGKTNGIICKSGKIIGASDVLITPVLNQPLPMPETLRGTRQAYEIDVLYGGSAIGSKIEDIDDVYINLYPRIAPDALRRCLDLNFFPTEIGIVESVTTRHDREKKTLSKYYSLNAKIWEPSLDGMGLGFQIANMVFTASKEQRGQDGKTYREMFSYIKDHGFIEDGIEDEAQEQLMHFCDLLEYCYKKIVGNESSLEVTTEAPQLTLG